MTYSYTYQCTQEERIEALAVWLLNNMGLDGALKYLEGLNCDPALFEANP